MAELGPIAANSPTDTLSGTIAGRFVISTRLGKGGMGEVYRAEDTKLKRTVALKRLAPRLRDDPACRHRFQEEAERVSRFADPHVAALHDIVEDSNETFFVMEYVEGETLRRRLNRPVSLDEFFRIAIQCAEALSAAHRQGIVHRDIKPENIMLTPEGQVKILDFGVAKCLPRDDQSTTVDRSTMLGGTPAYMSPEVLEEHLPDPRADLFSLGVVFYEMLTRHHPFLAGSFVATTDRVRKETPAPISIFNREASPELNALVQKLMAKEPSQRYASAAELLADLQALRTGTVPSDALVKSTRRAGSLRWTRALLAVIVVLFAVVLYRQMHSSGRSLLGGGRPIQLAVLPFEVSGDDAGMKAFSDGLTHTLAAKLTQLSGAYPVQVVPVSEVRTNNVTSADQARRDFGIGYVLEGSMHRSGNQVRVSYSLVDATTKRQLQADTVDARTTDAFEVEDRVVSGVVGMLGLEVQGNDRVALAAHGTSDPSAHDQYLRGRGYLLDYHKRENIDSAISSFNRALTLDPKYAQAYAALGEAYWLAYREDGDKKWIEQSKSACQHAVSQAAELADGYSCLGRVETGAGAYDQAITHFQKATSLEPTSDAAFRGLAEAYQKANRPADAEATYRRAISLRPQYWAGYSWLGFFYFQQGRYDDAAKAFQQVINLAPDNYRGYSNLGAIYSGEGKYSEAIGMLEKSASIRPTADSYMNLGTTYFFMHRFDAAARTYREALQFDSPKKWLNWGNLGDAYYWAPETRDQSGDAYRQAIQLANQALQVNPKDGFVLAYRATYLAMTDQKAAAMDSLQKALSFSPNDPDVQFRAALVYNHFGEKDRALEWLEKSVKNGTPGSVVLSTPDFDHLRNDARMQALLRTHS